MMEVPIVVDTFIDDVSGVTYYRVRYSDGRLEDMTQQQFEYFKASVEAVDELESQQNDQKTVSSDTFFQLRLG